MKNPLSTRYSLLSRMQNWEDQESWKDFFETYWRLIYSVATKAGLTDAEAQDVVQETVISVAKSIHNFKRDPKLGSFRGWLRHITQRRITDQLRKRTPAERESNRTPLVDIQDTSGAGLEPIWDREWQSNIFQAAVQRLKTRVKEEHYQIFHLHVLKQLSVPAVADKLGISVRQVYLVKHRVTSMLKKEIRRLDEELF